MPSVHPCLSGIAAYVGPTIIDLLAFLGLYISVTAARLITAVIGFSPRDVL